jgi:hypothetical protein
MFSKTLLVLVFLFEAIVLVAMGYVAFNAWVFGGVGPGIAATSVAVSMAVVIGWGLWEIWTN